MWIIWALVLLGILFVVWCCFSVSSEQSRIEEEQDGKPR